MKYVVDIVLVQPRDPTIDRLPFEVLNIAAIDLPPLNLLYLATVLYNVGFDVKIIDFNIYTGKELAMKELKESLEKKPLVCGIATTTPTFPGALNVARIVRKISPETTIIMGGYHVTFLPNEALSSPYVDIIVRGEGESTLLELILSLTNGNPPLYEIKGISYKKGKEIIHNPDRKPICDLDALPYPLRDLVPLDRYKNPSSIVSSRGCIGRCIFCVAHTFSKVCRLRSPENVVGEMLYLKKKYGFKTVFIVDNTFIADRKRTLEICELIKNLDLDMAWICETRVDTVDEELLRKMAEAGCVALQFGVESGDNRILQEIKKGITTEIVEKAVKTCIKVGIKPGCSFMIGHPSDTPETIKSTIEFAKKLKRLGSEVFFGITTPYPGTELYVHRDKFGIKIKDWDFSKWDTSHAIMETRYLSQLDLEKFFLKAAYEVYSVVEDVRMFD